MVVIPEASQRLSGTQGPVQCGGPGSRPSASLQPGWQPLGRVQARPRESGRL